MSSHPLESIFSIEPGSTPVLSAATQISAEIYDPVSGEIIERKVDDFTSQELEKEERIEDIKIDCQTDTIYNAAISAYESQIRMSQETDPRFSARNSEVAAQFLKIALDAVGSRTDAKYKRAKIRLAKNEAPKNIQNNLIVADRNSILKQLLEPKPSKE